MSFFENYRKLRFSWTSIGSGGGSTWFSPFPTVASLRELCSAKRFPLYFHRVRPRIHVTDRVTAAEKERMAMSQSQTSRDGKTIHLLSIHLPRFYVTRPEGSGRQSRGRKRERDELHTHAHTHISVAIYRVCVVLRKGLRSRELYDMSTGTKKKRSSWLNREYLRVANRVIIFSEHVHIENRIIESAVSWLIRHRYGISIKSFSLSLSSNQISMCFGTLAECARLTMYTREKVLTYIKLARQFLNITRKLSSVFAYVTRNVSTTLHFHYV